MRIKIKQAKRWTDNRTRELRYYIVAVDASGSEHKYTRYVTGNGWHPAKSWGTDFGEEGEPSAAVVAEYKRLTDGGRKSYYEPRPQRVRATREQEFDNIENDVVERATPRYNNDEELYVTA